MGCHCTQHQDAAQSLLYWACDYELVYLSRKTITKAGILSYLLTLASVSHLSTADVLDHIAFYLGEGRGLSSVLADV